MTVLAIDQGTSSTKALVIGDTDEILGTATVPVTPVAHGGGAVEQDPEQLWQSIIAAGRAALAAAESEPDCIAIANQGETVLRWDPRTGRALGPAISWQDGRAQSVTAELAPHARRLEQVSGLPLDPYFAAPKMTWLRRRVDRGGVITTIDAWITYRLTGRFVTDLATASRTMLLDLDNAEWSAEAMDLFEIDGALPEIIGCAEPVGETSAFGTSRPVTGLIVDQQAALLAESCFVEGQAKCTYGTGAFLLANAGGTATRSRARLAACVAWKLRDEICYCLDGQVFTAGAAVEWLRRVGLLRDAAEIDGLLAERKSDAELPLFVPALAGLGAPQWNPEARAHWGDLSLATNRSDLVAAVVWGIAGQVALLAEAMARDLGRPLQSIRVDGGLSQCEALLQAQADLLQLPVECYPSADATARGVCALARIGIGQTTDLQAAVGRWTPRAVIEPRMPPDTAAEILSRQREASRDRTDPRDRS